MPSLYIILSLNGHCEATILADRMQVSIATVERLEWLK